MIKVKISFSTNDAISVFKNAGLVVEMRNFEVSFPINHSDEQVIETIPIMAVINPFTGEPEKLEEAFSKFIELKKQQLFLSPEKLEIYNLFKH